MHNAAKFLNYQISILISNYYKDFTRKWSKCNFQKTCIQINGKAKFLSCINGLILFIILLSRKEIGLHEKIYLGICNLESWCSKSIEHVQHCQKSFKVICTHSKYIAANVVLSSPIFFFKRRTTPTSLLFKKGVALLHRSFMKRVKSLYCSFQKKSQLSHQCLIIRVEN